MSDPELPIVGEPLGAVRRPEWLRWALVVLTGGTAAALAWIGLGLGGLGPGTLILLAAAALQGYVAYAMATAASSFVVMTRDGFFDENGALLCPMSEVVGVDSGVFAFKPSKGFVARLRSRAPRDWSPGLWWRLGRRFAVGGATPGRDGKDMAERLMQLIAEREAGLAGD